VVAYAAAVSGSRPIGVLLNDVVDLDLSAGSDTQESVNTTRAALVDFVCARLGKKLNKGE